MEKTLKNLGLLWQENESVKVDHQSSGLHSNGDGGNTAVTAIMGTTFTVIP